MDNKLFEILCGYIDRGWTLTPMHSINNRVCNCKDKANCKKGAGKHPICGSDGKALATRNKKQIKTWLSDGYIKYSNWAVKCGKESKIIAFDIDPRNGGKRDSFPFPPTLEYRTGGGGNRLLYNCPDFEIEGNPNFGTGVELIVNGYIHLPPSNHISGKKYKWINDLPIADITPEFILLGNKPLSKESERFELPDEIKEGERDITAFKYACSLRAKGLEEPEILAVLRDANISRFNPPLDEEQLTYKVKSACKYQKGKTDDSDIADTPVVTESDARFKLGKASDAFEPRPPIQWIIKDVIKENSLNSWFGKYGHKKTFCALSAAVCVASGIPWIGQATIQCPVLFVDEESGQRTLLDRMEAAIKGESQDKEIPIYYLSLSSFNFLKNESDIETFQRYIEETHSKLIFIDALDDVMSGSDENSVKDNQPVMIQLRRVCEETNSAIILLHHVNKQGGMRGSTSIPGSLNSALKIISENGSSKISFTTDKMRDSKTFTKDVEIVYVDKNNDFSQLESFYLTEDSTPFEDRVNDIQKEILDFMKLNNNELVMNSFLESNKEKRSSYKKAIYSLRDHNAIKKNTEKSTRREAVYCIS